MEDKTIIDRIDTANVSMEDVHPSPLPSISDYEPSPLSSNFDQSLLTLTTLIRFGKLNENDELSRFVNSALTSLPGASLAKPRGHNPSLILSDRFHALKQSIMTTCQSPI